MLPASKETGRGKDNVNQFMTWLAKNKQTTKKKYPQKTYFWSQQDRDIGISSTRLLPEISLKKYLPMKMPSQALRIPGVRDCITWVEHR